MPSRHPIPPDHQNLTPSPRRRNSEFSARDGNHHARNHSPGGDKNNEKTQPLAPKSLSIEGVSTYYGRIRALHDVDLHIEPGEIVTLIGANGAGKSTLLMTICGNPRAATGTIHLDQENITHLPTHEIIGRGIALVPEGRRIFARMTVLENLQMGSISAKESQEEDDVARVFARFPILQERRHQRGGTLSGGEQQMLAIGRALMGHPRLLLLDEPSLGLAPMLMKQIFAVIHEINRQEGITILLVEQNAHYALELANRGFVLANGRIIMSGTRQELLASQAIRAAYLDGI
uniref:Branched-chain amino acid transport system ATP-binding protein n=1 Tax=Candidatus Kentrum sp. FW TaxID=2126338 RepID=A0A450TVC5_9GAMM|nr:MAG: branched-chain amino acid transport system ATP-binding protein [Candidatus Kentron sp. FW]